MSIEAKLLAWLVSIAMVFAVLFSAYEYGRHAEGQKRDNEALTERLEYAKAFDKAQAANDTLKTDGAEQHAQDIADNNRIRDEFSTFRLHLPKPSACTGVPNPSSGSLDGLAGSGIRPEPEQAAFDRFTDGLKQDSYRIDSALDSCRVVVTWARSLCKLNNTCMEAK